MKDEPASLPINNDGGVRPAHAGTEPRPSA